MNYVIRRYTASDETSWLHCRVLSFLDTAYYDDVWRVKPEVAAPGLELVAADTHNTVVGIMDVSVEGERATIDTVAVRPAHQHRGVGRNLLTQAIAETRALHVATLEAWTRDDPDTLRWYRAMGFTESDHYLHVYADYYTHAEEPGRAIVTLRPGLRPIAAFLHAKLTDEEQLRREFSRVHVCRRFAMAL